MVGEPLVTSNHGIVGDLFDVSTSALTRCFSVGSNGAVGSLAHAESPAASSVSAATVMRWRNVVMAMS